MSSGTTIPGIFSGSSPSSARRLVSDSSNARYWCAVAKRPRSPSSPWPGTTLSTSMRGSVTEPAEHAEIPGRFFAELLVLLAVVNDRRIGECLGTKAVLRMEVGEREKQRSIAREVLRDRAHDRPVAGAKASVDDQRC